MSQLTYSLLKKFLFISLFTLSNGLYKLVKRNLYEELQWHILTPGRVLSRIKIMSLMNIVGNALLIFILNIPASLRGYKINNEM